MQEQQNVKTYDQILILSEGEEFDNNDYKNAVYVFKRRGNGLQVLKTDGYFKRGHYVCADDINNLKDLKPHLFV